MTPVGCLRMKSVWVTCILVPLVASGLFDCYCYAIKSVTENSTDYNNKKFETAVKAQGGAAVAGSVLEGEGTVSADIGEGENASHSSATFKNGKGTLSAATGSGISSSLISSNSSLAIAFGNSENDTAVAVSGQGNVKAAGAVLSGDEKEVKSFVRTGSGKSSGSASGAGAATSSSVSGKKGFGLSSVSSGSSSAMGSAVDADDGVGIAVGSLFTKNGRNDIGGASASGSAVGGKAATSLAASENEKKSKTTSKGKAATVSALSTYDKK